MAQDIPEATEKPSTYSRREQMRRQRAAHVTALREEAQRLAQTAANLGVARVVLFGSLARGEPGLTSDLDLLIVWETDLDYLTRTVELYRKLNPHGPVDLLVYTPEEMSAMQGRAFIRKILQEGEVLYEA